MINIMYLHVGAELYGSDKVLAQLVTSLNRSQFKPFVVLPEHGPLEKKLHDNGIDVHIIEYPLLRRKYFSLRGVAMYVRDFFCSMKALESFVVTNKIDVIHSNTIAVIQGAVLAKRMHIPNVWHIHEIIKKPKAIVTVLNIFLAIGADKIVAISKATRDNLKQSVLLRNKEIELIYDGISPDVDSQNDLRKSLQLNSTDFVFGHVGRINAWKGQADFIMAGIPILRSNKDAYLVIAGDAYRGQEWRVDDLKKLIDSYKDVKDRIIYLGYVYDSATVFNTIDVFVSSSTQPEPFSMVTIEAMVHSKPVVAYDIAGPSEIVQSGVSGLLASPNDVQDLSLKMDEMIKNRVEVKTKGYAARIRVINHFNINEFVRRFEYVYKNVLDVRKDIW
ncbi:glycosyltransferase family 4 protein [Weissella confusa]|uniref:glycosyltransferase family 4 protein n=1 Tax=Weissella confusa TaxID=1583 RepID=UPI0018F157EE|nr:glycosyltransferase family 4 protein [Weissella confusa]MBJ7671170.1 glycosyltransferase family 4 protein [Weissella confusa]